MTQPLTHSPLASGRGDSILSEEERARVYSWLEFAKDVMLLSDWRLRLALDPPNENCWATITPTPGQLDATVRVSGWLLLEPEEEIQLALCHELMHLHHGHLLTQLAEVLEHGDPTLAKLAESTVRHHIEILVDQQARVLCMTEHLPSAADLAQLR